MMMMSVIFSPVRVVVMMHLIGDMMMISDGSDDDDDCDGNSILHLPIFSIHF